MRGIDLAQHTHMSHPKSSSQSEPRGPEGVPVDAPGNDAPAISPHAVSRMHRAEDDREAIENSPEFTDQQAIANDNGHDSERWVPGSPGNGERDDASRGLDVQDPKKGKVNPSHDTHKAAETAPRGRGDGEIMEQPSSESEARDPGAE